ncbi:hypothetical protein BDW59DRAFT_155503 [Aspergillus cavernicola]|uniref:Uncharacterized protein n=1 Tax=Aspergillus cavernicola TaxID=176166 RepID=A0ABR4H881_9EURO
MVIDPQLKIVFGLGLTTEEHLSYSQLAVDFSAVRKCLDRGVAAISTTTARSLRMSPTKKLFVRNSYILNPSRAREIFMNGTDLGKAREIFVNGTDLEKRIGPSQRQDILIRLIKADRADLVYLFCYALDLITWRKIDELSCPADFTTAIQALFPESIRLKPCTQLTLQELLRPLWPQSMISALVWTYKDHHEKDQEAQWSTEGITPNCGTEESTERPSRANQSPQNTCHDGQTGREQQSEPGSIDSRKRKRGEVDLELSDTPDQPAERAIKRSRTGAMANAEEKHAESIQDGEGKWAITVHREVRKFQLPASHISTRLRVLNLQNCQWLMDHLMTNASEQVELTLGETVGLHIDLPGQIRLDCRRDIITILLSRADNGPSTAPI